MTVEQKQHLLAYLKYYTGIVDGIWGSASKAATKELQEDNGITSDGIFGAKTEEIAKSAVFYNKLKGASGSADSGSDDFWGDIKYFKRSEFKCRCGGKYCNGYPTEPHETLVRTADKVRAHFGKAATVSSGVRCTQHNKNVGGVTNSKHLKGRAMDFAISGVSGSTLLSYVKTFPEVKYAYVISGNYVHMDIGG